VANKEPRRPTQRAYSVIKREGQDDYWLNIGLVFPHKDNGGFNIMLRRSRSTARSCVARSRPRMKPKSSSRAERSLAASKAASAADQQPQRAPRQSPGLAFYMR
jgi:hypothetical protein